MALRAGYYGLKKKLLEKVNALPGIKSIGDGLSLNSNTGVLSATGGGGGTTVVANPEEEATTDLTKLQVESTIYGIPEGTEVEANPSGTATTDLTKLQVGSTIYGIQTQPDITGKADITAIGTNETGSTASRPYAVGEHFYKAGKFCTAITAIAQDAAFTLNTNYVEGNISDNIPYIIEISGQLGVAHTATPLNLDLTQYLPANKTIKCFLSISLVGTGTSDLPAWYLPYIKDDAIDTYVQYISDHVLQMKNETLWNNYVIRIVVLLK